MLSRLIYGADLSSVGFLTMTFPPCWESPWESWPGITAASDSIISNCVNIMMSFPYILLAISVMAATGPGTEM
jgi:ABC-type dipeptide/oligopeptide/nickel transport system permease subunit